MKIFPPRQLQLTSNLKTKEAYIKEITPRLRPIEVIFSPLMCNNSVEIFNVTKRNLNASSILS